MSLKQPKVSTRTARTKKLEDRIIKLIEGAEDAGISPKGIYNITKNGEEININTIKSILKRLEVQGRIKKHSSVRGNYIVVNNAHDIFQHNIHNLMLTHSFDESLVIDSRHEEIEFGTIKLQLDIYPNTKNACMRVSTDYPFNISSLPLVAFIFKNFVEKYCDKPITEEQIIVKNIEFNQDFYGVKLEGIQAITFSGIISLFKIYKKNRNSVRMEYKNKIPFNFDILKYYLIGGEKVVEIDLIKNQFSKQTYKIEREQSEIREKMDKILYENSIILKNQKILLGEDVVQNELTIEEEKEDQIENSYEESIPIQNLYEPSDLELKEPQLYDEEKMYL